MAVKATVAGSGLTRPGFIQPSQDWTRSTWVYYPSTTPVTYFGPWFWGNDYGASIWGISINAYVTGGQFVQDIEANGAVVTTPLSSAGWKFVAVRYTAATHTVDLFVGTVLAASVTANLSALPMATVDALSWDGNGAVANPCGAAYDRIWQAALSNAEILAERTSTTAVRLTDLRADTPVSDQYTLSDISGHGHPWQLIGSVGYFPFTPQYASAFGLFGGFSRVGANGSNGLLALCQGSSGFTTPMLWLRGGPGVGSECGTTPSTTPLPGPGASQTDVDLSAIWIEYQTNGGSRMISASLCGLETENDICWPGHWFPPCRVAAGNANQSVEATCLFGTYDPMTGLHAADGSFEVKVDGAVVLSVTGIPLGAQNVEVYDNVMVGPCGIVDLTAVNAGISAFYLNDRAVYGASGASLMNEDYSALSAAQLWSNLAGHWDRWNNLSTPIGQGQGPNGANTTTDDAVVGLTSQRIVANTDFMTLSVPARLAPTPIFTQPAPPACPARPVISVAEAAGAPVDLATAPPTPVCVTRGVKGPTVGAGLIRAGAFRDRAADWTIAGWATLVVAGAAHFATLYAYGDAYYVGPYLWVGTLATDGHLTLEVFDGSSFTDITLPFTAGVRQYLAVRYLAATHTLSLRLDDAEVTATVNLGSIVFASTDEHLLTDLTGNAVSGMAAADWREWQRRLTTAQLTSERASESAVLVTDLLADTPMPDISDLTDHSGHSRDWFAVGVPANVAPNPPHIGAIQ